jgi:Fe-S oxidoreductase/nitrate reductase gamma subunit
MIKQLLFLAALLITCGIFAITVRRYWAFFRLTRPFPLRQWGRRFVLMLKVAIGQTRIFRFPFAGILHALVFWGFLVILFGSLEMVIDGLARTDRILSCLGVVYEVIIGMGDLFALIIAIAILVFLARRLLAKTKRFSGAEMKEKSHSDAVWALTLIFVLMISLMGMNTFYLGLHPDPGTARGAFPVSVFIARHLVSWSFLSPETTRFWFEFCWWTHILVIFLFVNILPYSKHFHVFMSVPNVFLSRLEPLGFLHDMPQVTREVRMMMDPDAAAAPPEEEREQAPGRFGVLDVEDITWKNYLDSLSCTECGRCTSVCPANITGKKLSPRKIMMDTRARMKEKGPGLLKKGKDYTDNKALIESYISPEELWACTTCNACARECPININHPSLIVDMRRYLVMEKAAAPGELNATFTNIENNGAPWQFSPEDRLLWAEGPLPVMQEVFAQGKKPEYLFWVGSAGAFDDRYRKVTRAFVKILDHLKVNYAVLGKEETDTADSARRAGNEMLYQMQTLTILGILRGYDVKKIITCCPHDYNTFKNEYPGFGGHFEVLHHAEFLKKMLDEGRLTLGGDLFRDKKITYHDPCYLGRCNGVYAAPRQVLEAIPSVKTEMCRNRSFALCCGAGGGQMFKEAEPGHKEVFIERTEEALATGADIIATACPFCMVMMTDGLKYKNKEEAVKNYDIAELVSMSLGLYGEIVKW